MLPKWALAFCDLASAKRDNGRGFFYARMDWRRGVDFGRPVFAPPCFSSGSGYGSVIVKPYSNISLKKGWGLGHDATIGRDTRTDS